MGKKCLLLILLLLILCIPAGALSQVDVYIDGRPLASDAPAMLEGGTTYVSLRAFSEQMGVSDISWNAAAQTARVEAPGLSVSVTAGERHLTANEKILPFTGSALIQAGRMFLPVRAIAAAFGASVSWDEANRAVRVVPGANSVEPAKTEPAKAEPAKAEPAKAESAKAEPAKAEPAKAEPAKASYNEEDLYWLSRIIEAESGGESFEGKLAVGGVVLNRVKDEAYPDTVKGVVFDTKDGVQFTPVANGTVYNTPSEDSVEAARRCLEGENVAGDCKFFLNPDIAESRWIIENCRYVMTIGCHDFYA